MRVPAVIFDPERIHCPACFLTLERGPEVCPRCAFSLQVARGHFPFQAPQMEPIMDPEERLSDKEYRKLDKAIQGFERRFPQLRFCVYLNRLPEAADAREFGFWLINHASPADGEDQSDRLRTILVVIDRQNRQASVTVGYGLDPFIGDDTGGRFLSDSKDDFIAGDFVAGTIGFMKRVNQHLSRVSRPACEAAERFRRAPKPDLVAE